MSTNMSYGVNENPPWIKKILYGLQHIFAAFGGIVAVPLVICGTLGFNSTTSTVIISSTIMAAGVATLIQARGVGPIGSKTACIMGTDFTFVSPAVTVGSTYGMPGIIGATIFGSIFEIILSFFIKPLMKLFPPIVTGTVVALIGLTLLPNSIDWAAGGVNAADYGAPLYIGIAMFVMIITLVCNRYGKGFMKSASILIGIVVGYLVCIPLKLIDFSVIANASWFSFPNLFEYGVTFRLDALFAFLPAYFVTTIETVGCLKAVGEASQIEIDDKRMSSGILADGVGSMLGGVLGTFPNTSFSQNIGIISLTKISSRFVASMAGILMIGLGFLPKFAAIVYAIPQPVLGGVGIVMFGMVAASGIKTLSKVKLTDRNMLIISTSLALGLGVAFRPEFIQGLPSVIQMIFASGISTGTIVALLLNLVLKEDKEEDI